MRVDRKGSFVLVVGLQRSLDAQDGGLLAWHKGTLKEGKPFGGGWSGPVLQELLVGRVRTLVALAGTRVGEPLPCHWKKLPGVTASRQAKPEHPVSCHPWGLLAVNHAIGHSRSGHGVFGWRSPRTDHKLAYTATVSGPIRKLGSEALVIVGVPAEDQVGIVVVEDVPERPHLCLGCPGGNEQRVVEVGHSAPGRVVGEGLLEPDALRRVFAAAAHFRAVAVENDNTPATPLVGVIALGGIPGPGSEVGEVSRGVLSVIFVVANRWSGARLLRPTWGDSSSETA
jgi:hypothetical protein